MAGEMSLSRETSQSSDKSMSHCPRDKTRDRLSREPTKEPTPDPPKSAPSEPLRSPAPAKLKRETLQRKPKKEVVRKARTPSPSPPTTVPEYVPEAPKQELPPPRSLTPTSSPTPEPSPLPQLEIPELPDFVFPDRTSSGKKIQKVKTMIAAPQTLVVGKETKKQRKAPPKVRKQVKVKQPKRSSAVALAEAPVTHEELQQVTDPLDFLAKYCIIHADRLPYYQRIFSKTTMEQSAKYPRPGTALLSDQLERGKNLNDAVSKSYNGSETQIDFDGINGDHLNYSNPEVMMPTPQFSNHEMKMLRDMTVLNRLPGVQSAGVSPGEQYMEKLEYSLEMMMEKQTNLQKQLNELEARRLHMIAAEARELFPDILSSNDSKKKKKSGKKATKKSAVSNKSGEIINSHRSTPVDERSEGPTPSPLANSDFAIMERLSDKMLDMVCAAPEITRIELQLERADEKLNYTTCRMEELEAEKTIIQMYCMESFFQDQMGTGKPRDFMRQQSALYNKLHPTPDLEMNLSEVGAALQTINNHLLTEKEIEYLFRILNLAGRPRINFQLFCVLAALSERVAQLDPLIKKLINKLNYEALDIKMERCKELFALLLDGEYLRDGGALASTLAVELTAGGLTPQHTAYVLSKFNRDGSGVIDFMDFVTYVPLFIEIHHRIVDDPLRVDLDL